MRTWIVVGVVALSLSLAGASEAPEATTVDWTAPEDVSVEGLDEGWYTVIDTSMGRIMAELLPRQAPQAVAHFARLAMGAQEWIDTVSGEPGKGHYYDGIKVHLAQAGERFEAGDRTGTGRGAPQMWIPMESGPINFSAPGRLGMTRTAAGRVSGVQFFATASSLPWLSTHHPCFGVVLSGREVITAISSVKTYGNGRPIEDVTIERLRVFKIGDPEPLSEPRPYTPTRVEIELRPDKQRR